MHAHLGKPLKRKVIEIQESTKLPSIQVTAIHNFDDLITKDYFGEDDYDSDDEIPIRALVRKRQRQLEHSKQLEEYENRLRIEKQYYEDRLRIEKEYYEDQVKRLNEIHKTRILNLKKKFREYKIEVGEFLKVWYDRLLAAGWKRIDS
jgi:hypothetical protein